MLINFTNVLIIDCTIVCYILQWCPIALIEYLFMFIEYLFTQMTILFRLSECSIAVNEQQKV